MGMILFCFMGLAAGIDLVRREVPGWMFWVFGLFGVAGSVMTVIENTAPDIGYVIVAGEVQSVPEMLVRLACSLAVGGGILLVSRLAEGAVGEGDGWFFLVTGLYVSWKVNLALLCYGLLLSSVYGVGLMIWGRLKGISVRKRKIPFLPFVWAAGMMMLTVHLWEV